jgi:hypothetical protein
VQFSIKNTKILPAEHLYKIGSLVDVLWKYVDRDGRIKVVTVLVNKNVVDNLGSVTITVDEAMHRHLELASQLGELTLSPVYGHKEKDSRSAPQKKVYSIVKIIKSEIAAPGSIIGDMDD